MLKQESLHKIVERINRIAKLLTLHNIDITLNSYTTVKLSTSPTKTY